MILSKKSIFVFLVLVSVTVITIAFSITRKKNVDDKRETERPVEGDGNNECQLIIRDIQGSTRTDDLDDLSVSEISIKGGLDFENVEEPVEQPSHDQSTNNPLEQNEKHRQTGVKDFDELVGDVPTTIDKPDSNDQENSKLIQQHLENIKSAKTQTLYREYYNKVELDLSPEDQNIFIKEYGLTKEHLLFPNKVLVTQRAIFRMLENYRLKEPIPFHFITEMISDGRGDLYALLETIRAISYRCPNCPIYGMVLHDHDDSIIQKSALDFYNVKAENFVETHSLESGVHSIRKLFFSNKPLGNPQNKKAQDVKAFYERLRIPNNGVLVTGPIFDKYLPTIRNFENYRKLGVKVISYVELDGGDGYICNVGAGQGIQNVGLYVPEYNFKAEDLEKPNILKWDLNQHAVYICYSSSKTLGFCDQLAVSLRKLHSMNKSLPQSIVVLANFFKSMETTDGLIKAKFPPMHATEMNLYVKKSGLFTGCTGDLSFLTAISLHKIPVYDRVGHKGQVYTMFANYCASLLGENAELTKWFKLKQDETFEAISTMSLDTLDKLKRDIVMLANDIKMNWNFYDNLYRHAMALTCTELSTLNYENGESINEFMNRVKMAIDSCTVEGIIEKVE